jgi:hypothetical protein
MYRTQEHKGYQKITPNIFTLRKTVKSINQQKDRGKLTFNSQMVK